MGTVFLGVGSNLGVRETYLRKAVESIEDNIGRIIKTSSVYETEPWGFISENKFLNMVAEVETVLAPSAVLSAILKIELLLGRIRNENRYSSRAIDIDILLYEDKIIDEINLKVPHPLMHERRFVLVPLSEIAPDLIHPVFKKSSADLLKSCSDTSIVRKHPG